MPHEINPVDDANTPADAGRPAATPQPPAAARNLNAPSRLFRWLDQRTGVHEIMKESLDEPIPGGARLAYVFGSGLLYIFISQIITGLCLALYYVPSAETAHTSVAYITKQVAAGAFLRSLHYYGSSAMIIVLALHFLQTFLYGSFKGRRELLWISGAVLSLLVLGMGFTGYLLPWDQKAYFATAVGTNIVGEIPFIGNWLTRLLRGGDTLGTLTISRFYVAHVFLIPAMIFAFIGAHILLFRKAGPAGPIEEDPITPKLAPEGFYPRQVLMDMTFALLIMVGLGILAYFHPAQLGPIADPANTQFIARPDWYYLPFFEWLKFFEGPKVVFAVVVVPGILALLFFLMPFLDRSLERRPWRRPIPVLSVAIVLAGLIFLGLRSQHDDQRDLSVRTQLAAQARQEDEFSKAPFEPAQEGPGGSAPALTAAAPLSPLLAHGSRLFDAHGCAACHGAGGAGGIAPKLIGISAKFPGGQLTNLLQHPNAAMIAGHMPTVDVSASEMAALTAYLGILGTPAAQAPVGFDAASAGAVAAATVAGAAATGAGAAASTGGGTAGSIETAGGTHPSSAAAAGDALFAQRGCAACHGVAGVGGRVPAMATLISGRSDAQVIQVLKVPSAKMKAGGMQPVAGTGAELSSVVAYLRTLHPAPAGQPPTTVAGSAAPYSEPAPSIAPAESGTPAAPLAGNAPSPSPEALGAAAGTATAAPTGKATAASSESAQGHAIFVSQGCAACHGVNAGGTHFAPALVHVSAKFPGAALPNLLHHPDAKMKAGGMPPVTTNTADTKKLLSYLTGLDVAPLPAAASGTPVRTATAAQPAAPKGAAANPAAPTPTIAAANVPLSPLALHGERVFQHYSCETCHGTGGLNGTAAAPGLAGTASMLPQSTLENLMRHHSIQMRNGNMPPTNMSANDLRALTTYIRAMPSPASAP